MPIFFVFVYALLVHGNDIYSSYRSDYYSDVILEPLPAPLEGGRVHLVTSSIFPSTKVSLPISSVRINGVEGLGLEKSSTNFTYFDWLKVKYSPKSNQIWISFHSRNTNWLKSNVSSILAVEVLDSALNTLVKGKVSVDPTISFKITYISTTENGKNIISHIHNYDATNDWEIEKIEFDGITLSTIQPITIPPNEHFIFTFSPPLGQNKNVGDLWTMSIFDKSGRAQVSNGGRIVKEAAPITAWVPSGCPFPRINDTNYQLLRESRIDTTLQSPHGFTKHCGTDFFRYVNTNLTSKDDTNFFLSDPGGDWSGFTEKGFERITAVHIYDEPDQMLQDYLAKLRHVLHLTNEVESKYPFLPTYLNGCMNRRSGMFSGITDFYSCDFYIGACAPCILPIIDGVIEQYKPFRLNQMPNPYLFYTQLYFNGWPYQANSQEINIQIIQAIMSGSKGLMIFEADIRYFPKDFISSIGPVFRSISLIREVIRTGDIDSMIISTDDSKSRVVTVRNQEFLVMFFVTKNADEYSGAACLMGIDKHWEFHDWEVKEVEMKSSQVKKIENVKEVVDGEFVDLKGKVEIGMDQGAIHVKNVELPKERPFRIFIMSYS